MKQTPKNHIILFAFLAALFSILPSHAQQQASIDSLVSKAGDLYNRDQLDSSEYYYNLVFQDQKIENKILGISGKIKISIFKNDFKTVDSLIHSGDQLIEGLPYNKAICRYNIMKGEYFRKASRFQEALSLHKQTIRQSANLPDASTMHADVLLYTALTYERMSEYDSSLVYAGRAYKIFQKTTDTTEAKFGTIANSIGVCYYRANKFNEAKYFYLKAKEIAEKKIGPTSSDLANVLVNLAALESDSENYEEAIRYSEQSLKISKAINDEDGMSTGYYSLAIDYYYLGDYGRAKDYLEACIEIRERIFNPLHSRLVWPYQVLGIVLKESSDHEQTILLNAKVRNILIANHGPGSLEEGLLDQNISTSFLSSGQIDSALFYINKANAILENKLSEDDYSLGILYFGLANTLYVAGEYDVAKNYIRKSMYINEINEYVHNSDYAQSICLLALIESSLKNYTIADSLLETSLSMIKDGDEFEYSRNAFWILGSYADYYYEKYKRTGDESALNRFNTYTRIYLDLSDNYRKQFHDPFSKSAVIENSVLTYQNNIGIYNALYRETKDIRYLNEAYSFSEHGRTALLRDMQDDKIKHYAGLEDSMLVKEKNLQKQVADLYQQYLEYPDSNEIRKALFEAKETLNAHLDLLLQINPRYYDIKFNSNIISISAIREKLEASETLIEYMKDDTAYYALVINRDTTELIYLGGKTTINEGVVSWRSTIIDRHAEHTNDICSRLYGLLIKPLEPLFAGERIIIVPSGPLFYLNFETLRKPGLQGDYLIYAYNISYALSLNVLYSEKPKHHKKGAGLAIAIAPGFEDDIKHKYTTALDSMEFVDDDFLHTVRQPWSVKLAQKLKREYRNNAFTGIDATESNIKSNLYKGNVLYFGTHAITNAKDPLRSKLVLAKEIGSQNEDGYLHAYEMYGLELDADLAVLNACESGIGNLKEGEGMISLAYSLNFAGCPSTIMSLWKVDEKTNTYITDLFFKYLSDGQSKSEALRNAKLEFLATADPTSLHPYYWSGMVLMGNDGVVPFKQKKDNKLLILCIVLIIIGFAAWTILRPSK